MYNRLILVAGSGRSGTSLFSGMLQTMGCHIPQPEVSADDTNPRGFGEPQWVIDFHSTLLQRAGVQTSDARPGAWAKTAELGRDREIQEQLDAWLRNQFRHGDHVVIKDPRLLWFIPMWNRVGETMAAPCFVTMLRHPLEVIKSKQTYYGQMWHPNARTAGWLNTMLYTERATRGNRRTLVRYEDLLTDPMVEISRISGELDLALVERSSPQQMRTATRLADPSLRRATTTWEALGVDHRLVEMVDEVWAVLVEAATKSHVDDEAVKDELDRLRQDYLDLHAFVESTAQFSIVAAERGKKLSSGGNRRASERAGADSLRKVLRRAKRKGKRSLHQLRIKQNRSGSGDGSAAPRQ